MLHLVVDGYSVEKVRETIDATATDELVVLTEKNAREVLEKIFAADGVAVWGKIE